MMSTLRIAATLGVIALGVALASTTLSAQVALELRGSALRAVSALTEPGGLLILGTILAGLSHVVARRRSSS